MGRRVAGAGAVQGVARAHPVMQLAATMNQTAFGLGKLHGLGSDDGV